MGKRQLINSIIIFFVFFIARIIGIADELILILISIIITAIIIYSNIVIFIIIYSKKDYDEIKQSFSYLKELQQERYKANFKICTHEEMEDEFLEYETEIKVVANIILLNSSKYLRCKYYRFLPKIIYRKRQEKIAQIKEETKKILEMG